MSAAVGMADEMITNDQHGFDSFKETLREDLKHVLIRQAAHFHSFTSSLSRSLSSGICSRLLWIAPRIFSSRAVLNASLSCVANRSNSSYAAWCVGSS